MDTNDIETISESLVREYLSRKGLKETLKVMDQECPRKSGSISNRADLATNLNIDHLMKRNKTVHKPLRSMIEIITQDLLNPGPLPTRTTNSSAAVKKPPSAASRQTTGEANYGSGNYGDLVLDDNIEDGETFVGEGKAGVMGKKLPETDVPVYTGSKLSTSGGRTKPPRSRGLSGQISSDLDDRERQRMLRIKGELNKIKSPPATTTYEFTLDGGNQATNTRHNRKSDLLLFESKPDTTQPVSHNKPYANEKNASANHVTQKPVVSDSKRLESILSADVNSRLNSASRSSRRSTTEDNDLDCYEYGISRSSITSDTRNTSSPSNHKIENKSVKDLLTSAKPAKHKAASPKLGDLELGDVDDLDNEINDLQLGSRIPLQQPSFTVDSEPITIKMAVDLKNLILGSAQQNFNDEWKYQSFTFCDLPKLQYGIVQKKGGPCGVLASVQACLLQEILYRDGKSPAMKDLQLTRHRRSEMLASALSTILWRCGDGSSAIVAVPARKAHFPGSSRIKSDNVTETLMVNTLKSIVDLKTFLHQNISQFELDGSSGVILALYSAVLTRTIKGVRSDMDEPTSKLMGAHGYCTQDMVNLFITGRANSNVFNDVVELEGDNDTKTVLKGISGRADVGLLSLFEHYRSCQVGTYLKTPRHPIWVICSESHFSVLFSLKKDLLRDWKAEKRFDVYYYDGLGKQDEEIRLSLDTTNRFFQAPTEDDLIPPLEHCIRTKWPDTEIDWNGTEPLL